MPDVYEIDAGQLRQRVIWQVAATVEGAPDSHTDKATLWAKVDPFRGTEQMAARQRVGETFYTVVVRYNEAVGIKSKDRFLWNGLPLEIESAYPKDGRTAYIECQCTYREDSQ